MKLKLSTILIIVAMIASIGVVNATTHTNNVTIANLQEISDSIPKMDSQISTATTQNDPIGQYAIVAKNYDEFAQLLKVFNPIKVYPYIQTIVIDAMKSEAMALQTVYPGRVLDMKIINQMEIPKIPEIPSSISLDTENPKDEDFLGVSGLWDMGYHGENVVVGVIDNGVDFTHPGLVGQKNNTVRFNKNPFTNETAEPCRTHGTPVTGTIASTGKTSDGSVNPDYRGMAYASKIYSLEMGCSSDGETVIGDMLGALNKVVAENQTIKVVNLSLGSPVNYMSPIVDKVIQAGIVLVAAAGNEGPKEYTVSYPGGSINSIGVGAISYSNLIAPFSSIGPLPGMIYKPDVVAQGASIYSTVLGGGYDQISGTSFSSPYTAGAIATLISALQANNIKYNPGLIKAAILETAVHLPNIAEIKQGQGRPNITGAYDLITSAKLASDNIPQLVSFTPKIGDFMKDVLFKTYRDVSYDIPITMIASHPLNVSISITGDLDSIVSVDTSSITDIGSQVIYLHVNTTGKTDGDYTGSLIMSLGDYSTQAEFTITVNGAATGKILMDLGHTTWDNAGQDLITGTNTGVMSTLARNRGYWIQEYSGDLSQLDLSQYDVIWLPDPSDLASEDISGAIIQPLLFTQNELDAVNNYVNNGGSLFVDFNGYIYDDQYDYYYGTNATEINRLIGLFGITTSTEAIIMGGSEHPSALYNFTAPVGSVTKIAFLGNYLDVSGDAKVLSNDNTGDTIAINDVINGGRVLVTSTNFWLDNNGAAGLYSEKTQNVKFSNNVWDWLTSSNQVKFISSKVEGNTITGQYQVIENGVPATSSSVKLFANSNIASQTITAKSLGDGKFEFTYTGEEEGKYVFQVAIGKDYARWELNVDKSGPIVIPDESNANMTGFDANTNLYLTFFAKDNITELTKSSFEFKLDDSDIDPQYYSYTYNPEKYQLVVGLMSDILTNTNQHWYKLTIKATDANGISSITNYYFYVGKNAPEPLVNNNSSETTKSPISLLPMILSIVGVAIFIRKRK